MLLAVNNGLLNYFVSIIIILTIIFRLLFYYYHYTNTKSYVYTTIKLELGD